MKKCEITVESTSIADEMTEAPNGPSTSTAECLARWFAIFTIVLLCGALLVQPAQLRGSWALHVAGTERDQILSTLPEPNGGSGEKSPKKEGQWEFRRPEICFMCRRTPPPQDRSARDGEAIFSYIDRGEGIDDEFALVQQRLTELGYELRCSGSDFRGSWFFYDQGPESHVIKVVEVIVDSATVERYLSLSVLTTVYGARPIGSTDYVSEFPQSCL